MEKQQQQDIKCELGRIEDSEKNPSPRWDLNPRPSVIKSHLGQGFFSESSFLPNSHLIIIIVIQFFMRCSKEKNEKQCLKNMDTSQNYKAR